MRLKISGLILPLIFLLFPPFSHARKNAAVPVVNDVKTAQETPPPVSSIGDIAMEDAGFVNLAFPPFPKFYFDMRYATPNNCTKKVIYDFNACWLRDDAARALVKAYTLLQKRRPGTTFLFYDCYRPSSYHQKLWDAFPDARYVAPPAKGSRHSRGMAVDVTLAGEDGTPLEMPTEFDNFSPRAHADYNGRKISAEAKANRELLKQVMVAAGFYYTRTEWWHFDKAGWSKYPITDIKP